MRVDPLVGGVVSLCLVMPALTGRAQDQVAPSFAEENPEEAQPMAPTGTRYNIPWGSGGLNLSAGLRGIYVDNVFLTHSATRDDFIFVPECDVSAFFPIGRSNTIVLDLGIAYYYYVNNTELNAGGPIINPNSEVAFNIHSGDFTF